MMVRERLSRRIQPLEVVAEMMARLGAADQQEAWLAALAAAGGRLDAADLAGAAPDPLDAAMWRLNEELERHGDLKAALRSLTDGDLDRVAAFLVREFPSAQPC